MLGDNIRKLRIEKKLSYRSLAAKSGVSATAICALEKGSVLNPTFDTIEKLAKALDTNSDVLFGSYKELINLINYARAGRSIEEYSKDTGIVLDYLDKLCRGDISEAPSKEILKRIAGDNSGPDDIIVGYIDLMEAAGHIDHQTARKVSMKRSQRLANKFDNIPMEEINQQISLYESITDLFNNTVFSISELEDINNFIEFLVAKRKKK